MTQSQLAATLGISRQLLAYHLKSRKAPPLDDTSAWIEFLSANGRNEGSMPKEVRKHIARERLRLIKAQADRVELENKVRRNEMIEAIKAASFIKYMVAGIFFSELDRLASEFPAALKGKDEIAIHEECERQIEFIKGNLRSQMESWVQKQGCI